MLALLVLLVLFESACRTPPQRESGAPSGSGVVDATTEPGTEPDAVGARAWPTLPRTLEAQRALIAASTLRPVARGSTLGDGGTEARLAAFARGSLARLDHAVAGEAAIRRWLATWFTRVGSRDAYVLFGTHHDSGAQVRAFRALVRHPTAFTTIALEQLIADGRWGGLDLASQRADDADLSAFLGRGDLASLERLRHALAVHDYTSWKFGYEGEVLDVVLAARATGQYVATCDMSLKVRELLVVPNEGAGDEVSRLRELHCLLALRALEGHTTGPRRVAMLWGQAHAGPSGFARFLPPEAAVLVVHLFGGRAPPFAPRPPPLVLNDPVMIPPTDAAPTEVALWLPDSQTSGDVDRVRRAPEPRGRTEIRASSLAPATLTLAPSAPLATSLGRDEITLPVGEGPLTYVLRAGAVTIVGALTLGQGERATLSFDPARRGTRIELEARP